jgi:hypothetical protein
MQINGMGRKKSLYKLEVVLMRLATREAVSNVVGNLSLSTKEFIHSIQ